MYFPFEKTGDRRQQWRRTNALRSAEGKSGNQDCPPARAQGGERDLSSPSQCVMAWRVSQLLSAPRARSFPSDESRRA